MCGKDYTFYRKQKDMFGVESEDATVVTTILGLYHEENGRVSITTGDTTQIRTKKLPRILCKYDDEVKKLRVGDKVSDSKDMLVTGITDIQDWGLIADISLEVFDNGNNT